MMHSMRRLPQHDRQDRTLYEHGIPQRHSFSVPLNTESALTASHSHDPCAPRCCWPSALVRLCAYEPIGLACNERAVSGTGYRPSGFQSDLQLSAEAAEAVMFGRLHNCCVMVLIKVDLERAYQTNASMACRGMIQICCTQHGIFGTVMDTGPSIC